MTAGLNFNSFCFQNTMEIGLFYKIQIFYQLNNTLYGLLGFITLRDKHDCQIGQHWAEMMAMWTEIVDLNSFCAPHAALKGHSTTSTHSVARFTCIGSMNIFRKQDVVSRWCSKEVFKSMILILWLVQLLDSRFGRIQTAHRIKVVEVQVAAIRKTGKWWRIMGKQ